MFTFKCDNSKEIRQGEINRPDQASQGGINNDSGTISANSNLLLDNRSRYSDNRNLTHSPLGRIMNKIGLKFGDHTGHNLNKLIKQKPSEKNLHQQNETNESDNIEALLMTDEREGEYWQIIKQSY